MARAKKQLLGNWKTEQGDKVWVYQAGDNFVIRHGDHEHACHPSIRSLGDTEREAAMVFHVSPTSFETAS